VEVVDAFFSVAGPAQGLLASPEIAACWDHPSALADYTVAGLAGHLLRAIGRTESLLEAPEPTGAEIIGLSAFFGAVRIDGPTDRDSDLHRAIRRDGEAAAEAGPAALADGFGRLLDRLGKVLAGARPDRLVPVLTVPGAATTLEQYLRSRIVEVIVRVDDLAASAGVTAPEPETGPASIAIGVLVELARAHNGDLRVIRALARRERAEPEDLWAL
jgi:hypothetical protein